MTGGADLLKTLLIRRVTFYKPALLAHAVSNSVRRLHKVPSLGVLGSVKPELYCER